MIDWARVEALFDAAGALPEEQRAAFVAGSDATDKEQAEVMALLAAEHGASGRLRRVLERETAALVDADARIGSTFGDRYRIVARLGEGGFGAVYRAVQLGMDRDVALKLAYPRREPSAKARARFDRELKLTAKLDHPNCVRVHDHGLTEDGVAFFAMELVTGESLAAVLSREGRLPEARVRAIARQVALALGEAHAHGIVHRDLKPDNIMLTVLGGQPEHVKVVDFGIARIVEDEVETTITGAFIGTPAYASPEQAAGDPVDTRADLYSLGVLLFRMIVGVVPFSGDSPMKTLHRHVMEAARPVAAAAAEAGVSLSHGLAALVDDLLAKSPDARPQTVDEVLRRLDGATRRPTRRAWRWAWLGLAPLLFVPLLCRDAAPPRPVLPSGEGVLVVPAGATITSLSGDDVAPGRTPPGVYRVDDGLASVRDGLTTTVGVGDNAVLIGGHAVHLDAPIHVRTYREPDAPSFYRTALEKSFTARWLDGKPIDRSGLMAVRARIAQVILHTVDLSAERDFANLIEDGVSIHFIVARDGTVLQPLDIVDGAFHAGEGNDGSIGIHLEGDAPSDAQYASLAALGRLFVRFFPRLEVATPRDGDGAPLRATLATPTAFAGFLGHNHYEPERPSCPSARFDWERLLRALE